MVKSTISALKTLPFPVEIYEKKSLLAWNCEFCDKVERIEGGPFGETQEAAVHRLLQGIRRRLHGMELGGPRVRVRRGHRDLGHAVAAHAGSHLHRGGA